MKEIMNNENKNWLDEILNMKETEEEIKPDETAVSSAGKSTCSKIASALAARKEAWLMPLLRALARAQSALVSLTSTPSTFSKR